MLSLGPLAFAAPWALIGLLSLPVIWWLLRATPPAPQRVRFPAIRLLLGLVPETESPAHTPLWLLLLRLTLAALIIVALAAPLWRPADRIAGSGPLLIIIDNGWASASDWSQRQALTTSLITQAARDNRRVAVVGSAPDAIPEALGFEGSSEAESRLGALQPQPLDVDRLALIEKLQTLTENPSQAIWISDGLEDGEADALASYLTALNSDIELIEPLASNQALALLPPAAGTGTVAVPIIRANKAALHQGDITAFAVDGRPLGRAPFSFSDNDLRTEAIFNLPLELRNEISRISLSSNATAGSTLVLDERWRRRTLGMVSGTAKDQPLLSDLYYLERALEPFVDVRTPSKEDEDASSVAQLLAEPLSVLLLSDLGRLSPPDVEITSEWIKDGGVLVRFAGPRLAAQTDPLIPVPLRSGGRELGGALSWTEPQTLAPFAANSPFSGIAVPEDVTIKRQVLADPRGNLAGRVWAQLKDGTPLVTARAEGDGWIVLFHVTANAEWSNLALSGLYVDMLRRLVDLAQGTAIAQDTNIGATLAPRMMIDAFGNFTTPPPWTIPITRADLTQIEPTAIHPPGLYGDAGSARALNLTNAETVLTPLPELEGVTSRRTFTHGNELDLKAPIFVIAFLLLLADGIAALVLSGKLSRQQFSKAHPAALSLAALLLISTPGTTEAAESDEAALAAVLETHLAYVLTGDSELDELSHAGLTGLSDALRRRTALEPGVPIGVNIEQDELAFFPLLYWPISEFQSDVTPAALARIEAYMRQGGTILFDTRDQDRTIQGLTTRSTQVLRDLLEQLDIPPLEPVPDTHVLTKAFYLLADFPGRWDGGHLWIERARAGDGTTSTSNDGVSAILIGSNDYAGAWARDASGRALYAAVPGGERQREIAARTGVNIVMYALTGNYKADQVHLPALLERLGQ
ncbi:DUF4159 domain-containing protein [Parvibaculaceae bacterium PLY_AMNH_Bact1]|nr:DUF4159 domain-containing protein [Parvibaculaceae bacterium PLY_AMNH_Bact1]